MSPWPVVWWPCHGISLLQLNPWFVASWPYCVVSLIQQWSDLLGNPWMAASQPYSAVSLPTSPVNQIPKSSVSLLASWPGNTTILGHVMFQLLDVFHVILLWRTPVNQSMHVSYVLSIDSKFAECDTRGAFRLTCCLESHQSRLPLQSGSFLRWYRSCLPGFLYLLFLYRFSPSVHHLVEQKPQRERSTLDISYWVCKEHLCTSSKSHTDLSSTSSGEVDATVSTTCH